VFVACDQDVGQRVNKDPEWTVDCLSEPVGRMMHDDNPQIILGFT
jgi:hypothetical protein